MAGVSGVLARTNPITFSPLMFGFRGPRGARAGKTRSTYRVAERLGVGLAVVLLVTFWMSDAKADPAPLFRLHDPRLVELSGIAAGIASPGVLYVHNDSGDTARFFALDRRTGRMLAQYTVPAAQNVDLEDIAVTRDARGSPSVWLADIGDNTGARASVTIYRVDEPQVSPGTHRTRRPQVWRLRYPSGPVDAESLAVSPRGVPYVITKSLSGVSQVYRAPAAPGASRLRRVATIRFRLTGTPGPFAPFGELAATGAAISRDGSLLVVRTYTDAYLWTVRQGDLARVLHAPPTRLALPRQPQGEGVCFDGAHLLLDSEGRASAVYQLALPPLPLSSTSSPSATATTPRTITGSPVRNSDPGLPIGIVEVFAVLVVLVGIGVAVPIRRRNRRGRAGSTP